MSTITAKMAQRSTSNNFFEISYLTENCKNSDLLTNIIKLSS